MQNYQKKVQLINRIWIYNKIEMYFNLCITPKKKYYKQQHFQFNYSFFLKKNYILNRKRFNCNLKQRYYLLQNSCILKIESNNEIMLTTEIDFLEDSILE